MEFEKEVADINHRRFQKLLKKRLEKDQYVDQMMADTAASIVRQNDNWTTSDDLALRKDIYQLTQQMRTEKVETDLNLRLSDHMNLNQALTGSVNSSSSEKKKTVTNQNSNTLIAKSSSEKKTMINKFIPKKQKVGIGSTIFDDTTSADKIQSIMLDQKVERHLNSLFEQ